MQQSLANGIKRDLSYAPHDETGKQIGELTLINEDYLKKYKWEESPNYKWLAMMTEQGREAAPLLPRPLGVPEPAATSKAGPAERSRAGLTLF